MNFGSDNIVGASEPIIEALATAARGGPEGTYGSDRWTDDAIGQLRDVFETDLDVFLVPTGTAANALSLAAVTPPWGGVFCHAAAHVIDEEAGAPEFFTGGAKLVGIAGRSCKIEPDSLRETLMRFPRGLARQVQGSALSLSQATECGTTYSPAEIAALAEVARGAGLAVHMDGARFANALVDLGCSAAAMTWRAGVDVLSFGATKNGALACEAVIFFNRTHAQHAEIQRKRSGHTLSKGRLLGAQMAAYLRDGHWLDLARSANGMAERLARGLAGLPGFHLPFPRQANEVFAVMTRADAQALHDAGAHFYDWDTSSLGPGQLGPDQLLARFVCSYATTAAEVDGFLVEARRVAGAVASSPQ